MSNQITWRKDQRQIAKDKKQCLFAVGLDDRDNPEGEKGQWIQTGIMETDKAVFLFIFAQELYDGKNPKSAFDAVTKRVGKRK